MMTIKQLAIIGPTLFAIMFLATAVWAAQPWGVLV